MAKKISERPIKVMAVVSLSILSILCVILSYGMISRANVDTVKLESRGMFMQGPICNSSTDMNPVHSPLQCLSFDSQFDSLLSDSDPIFILMPAKAGGTSVKEFAKRCSGYDPEQKPHHADNFLNYDKYIKSFLTATLRTPKIIASHLYSEDAMIDIIRYAGRRSLLIYVYRDETDRVMSAIKYVVKHSLCEATGLPKYWSRTWNINKTIFGLNATSDECIFDEMPLVDYIIQPKAIEIGFSIPSQLTCRFWKAINEMGPNMVFVHYTELDALQSKIATIFCPDVVLERKNDDGERRKSSRTFTIRLQHGGNASVDEWVEAKKSVIEYSLKLSNGTCKQKTRRMEDVLLSCPNNKAVRVFPSHLWPN